MKPELPFNSLYLLTLILGCAAFHWQNAPDNVSLALQPHQLAVVYDQTLPTSRRIAYAYAKARNIPQRNIIPVTLKHQKSIISEGKFAQLKRTLQRRTPAHVQAYWLVWDEPYQVECMSLGAALTFGFDTRYCSENCQFAAQSTYFDHTTHRPYEVLNIRPTMLLGTLDPALAKVIIDRGKAADFSQPDGQVLLAISEDTARNVRQSQYSEVFREFSQHVKVRQGTSDELGYQQDILLYSVGAKQADNLDKLRFLPGAVADHLTSFGGLPPAKAANFSQMSALAWLKQGASGSYGTVAEPCNYPEKFPQPAVFLKHYLRGDTLIEAYWKSVAMPGQGNFIGEPLAKPFALGSQWRQKLGR